MIAIPPSMSQSLVLFILISVGFAAGKAGVLKGASVRSLSRFLVDFTLPAIIIVSMQRPFSPELRDQALRILAISFAVYAASFPLAYGFAALYRRSGREELGVHRFAMCFSNVAFMGFPVAESLLGRESLFIVAIYNIPFQLLAFSVGIIMISGNGGGGVRGGTAPGHAPGDAAPARPSRATRGFLKALRNPAIISALIGFALFLGSVRIPEPLFASLELLGGMTTPLAMVVIGAVLSQTRLSGVLGNPRLWATTAYRLALHPLLVFASAKAVGLSGMELAVPVLVSSMPVAANSTILAGVYGGDDVTASGLVFVSTLLSLATIPIIGRLIL
ncbi:MAG: AEC family transporter [Spirochaetes bacterium]|nr:AEC family transporter [Spirochaetota bacterium]MBU1080547.1 AEC family transporter [Spirochaetota bacterium]